MCENKKTTVKILKIQTPEKFAVITLKFEQGCFTRLLYHKVMCCKDAGGMANNVDPDQTGPLVAVWSWSALFAETCLFENLGPLWYSFWNAKW